MIIMMNWIHIICVTSMVVITACRELDYDDSWKPLRADEVVGRTVERSGDPKSTRPGIDYHFITERNHDHRKNAASVAEIDDIAPRPKTTREKATKPRRRNQADVATHRDVDNGGDDIDFGREFGPLNIYSNFQNGFEVEDCKLFGNCKNTKEVSKTVKDAVRPQRQVPGQPDDFQRQNGFIVQEQQNDFRNQQNEFQEGPVSNGPRPNNEGQTDFRRPQNNFLGPQNNFEQQQRPQHAFEQQQRPQNAFEQQQRPLSVAEQPQRPQNNIRPQGPQNNLQVEEEEFRATDNEIGAPQDDFRRPQSNGLAGTPNDNRGPPNSFRGPQNGFRGPQNGFRGQQDGSNDFRGPQNGPNNFRGPQNGFRGQGPNQFRGPNGPPRPVRGGTGQFQNNRSPGPMQMLSNLIRTFI